MPAAKPKAAAATTKPKTPRQTKLNFSGAKTKDTPGSKQKKPVNGNILNFFKKIDDDALFIEDAPCLAARSSPTPATKPAEPEEEKDIYGIDDVYKAPKYYADGVSSKRRKLSHAGDDAVGKMEEPLEGISPGLAIDNITTKPAIPKEPKSKLKRIKGKGPFLDDSESEGEAVSHSPTSHESADKTPDILQPGQTVKLETPEQNSYSARENAPAAPNPPAYNPEDSVDEDVKDPDDMDEVFDEDDFADGGEEFREMKYMQEQARLEDEEAGNYNSDAMADEGSMDHGITQNCPLCDATLAGVTPDEATIHVNACLDGNPLPLPKSLVTPSKLLPSDAVDTPDMSKRFSKAAVPRPGQANPINLDGNVPKATSAFSKLMSGHAEDAAWASAAAAETAARGRPAYERTCPFYKIMPGFFICVDAFRYGAVQGCKAYFLSHFHSDHYIGLTAKWSHGPIYCSKVTGSLVKQQLRTNPKWVVELEFDEKFKVPGTEGVFVTMIPANHCPGSSLFLFEKVMGKGPNSRTQRILHCGDFRACPAHVNHPTLKPEIVDAVSGKTQQQKIDVCYLDTTYLNPRYSFPPQEDVINACAQFCKNISGDPSAPDDAYEALKRETGVTTVSKFFVKEPHDSSSDVKTEADGTTTTTTGKKNPKHRLLVICGTYSIGKERICKAIAQALNTKIFASPSKIKIIKQLSDPELSALLTSNPREAQVHMQMLMEIRAETLQEYLNGYKPHFSRIVGFRPSGWNFRGPSSTAKGVSATMSPSTMDTAQLLHGSLWRTRFGPLDFVAQRGSTREAMCFGVPYSEHSSFRELALFVMALRIEKVVPTVNVGSAPSRQRMKGWTDRWIAERRRGGLVRLSEGDRKAGEKERDEGLWEGKDNKGGGVWW
ncbi:DNA repair metallo-beta-lactamase-domain-containing protein [Pseudomassariella vexata]|uniref:DNA repair metallo-beta-lactamase-domain-containing protein n=1 Tax=Pseudomassariella vexata TaxID=1141098 RepID=A0A1Y2DT46_9PEZI|nr:DNA repair metallo-beta-lactamase-domain-containing protein [Pseudomassariella vexata]ORY62316.1 DNA repair metallo-beta-lactamase-domain-containing protein [Pseudomassariella vexata]